LIFIMKIIFSAGFFCTLFRILAISSAECPGSQEGSSMDFGNRGLTLVNSGKPSEAADCFWIAADSSDSDTERLTWLKNAAQACEQSERTESALEGYLEYANIKKQMGESCDLAIVVRLASLLQTFQRLPDAASAWAEAAELEPGSAEIRANYGAVLAQLGQHAEAAVQLQTAIAKKPDLPAVVFSNLAVSLRALGREGEASQVRQRRQRTRSHVLAAPARTPPAQRPRRMMRQSHRRVDRRAPAPLRRSADRMRRRR
jgi:tetratricopeptide (TPR) repeat protein